MFHPSALPRHFAHGTSGALLLIAGGSVAVAKDGGENTQGYLDLLKMGNPLLGESIKAGKGIFSDVSGPSVSANPR